MPSSLIEMQAVSYRAGETLILDKASWSIQRGDHWALLGPNGAGKTTLLRIACGYIWANAGGEVLRLGKKLTDLRELRRSVGWVSHRLAAQIPQRELSLDTVVSGRVAQVGLRKQLHGPLPNEEDYSAARAYLEQLESGHLAGKAFGVLSQGEQQKILIARALMALPLVIFLDEPCAGLDPGARERFLATIERLADDDESPSLILVTHHIEEITPSFDKLLVLHSGRIVRDGAREQTIDEDLIQEIYGIRPRELCLRNGRTWPIF